MLILTKKTRGSWFYEFARSGSPASVAPYKAAKHLGLVRPNQKLYEAMDNSGLVALPGFVHYHGHDRIFFINQALREIIEDAVDIFLPPSVLRDKREALQATRVTIRDHCYERFDEDLYSVLESGNLNDWPPGQGSLLNNTELPLDYPSCDFERQHLDSWRELVEKV